MWNTSDGERVVTEPEWIVIRTGAINLWESMKAWREDGEPSDTGIDRFDALTFEQQAWSLYSCLRALRESTIECPNLIADTEATIGAIFAGVADMEYSLADNPQLRAAVATASEVPAKDLPKTDTGLIDLLEVCADRILWDRDYEFDEIDDADPDTAKHVRGLVTIDDAYFSSAAPEPTAAELAEATEYLESLRPPRRTL